MQSKPLQVTERQTGIRVDMVEPGSFIWVLVAPDGDEVVELVESSETYGAWPRLAAAESVLKTAFAE